LKAKHGRIVVIAVMPGLEPFWDKMVADGLVEEWYHLRDTPAGWELTGNG
jgi:hypothetical protein